MTQELGYQEFKAFCECIEYPKQMQEDDFQDGILNNFASTKNMDKVQFGEIDHIGGLTLQGFQDFLVHQIEYSEAKD